MRRILLFSLAMLSAGFLTVTGQNNKTEVLYPTEFHETKPLRELIKEHPYVRMEQENESEDRSHRPVQTFVHTAADGPEYGEDPSVRQTTMGTRNPLTSKSLIKNWEGQNSSSYPPDPSGAVGLNHFVQMINATPFRVYDKSSGSALFTANLSTLFSSSTNDGDPIVMYDKFADRWFLSQFGSSGNKIFIAISKTSDPGGAYYTYTYTSPQFPDYEKFSIWENGYYMTSNQSTDRVFCFERTEMLAGNSAARSVSATFTTGTVSSFFVPMPADASDGQLPPAGTPLPFFAYTENSWGTGVVDGIKIWNMTVTWGTTPAATSSLLTTITTSAFDGTYNSSWNDVTQPGTTAKLDGIGGVLSYRVQWRPWNGYNTAVMCWPVLISSSTGQRSIRWAELRQDQTSGTWSLYQESTFAPDAETRWMGSIAMDDNGSIGLGYCKSSSTTYPSLCYTGRLASDPLGTMSFAETVVVAGTSTQTSNNRYGDYSQTSLDPDGITFWHTGEYISGGAKTRIFSFQLPNPTLPPVADFAANTIINNCSGDIQFTDASINNPNAWLWDFGDGQTSTLQNPSHSYAANGTYTVTLTSTNSYGDNTIIKDNYVTINMPVAPQVSDVTACQNTSVALTATASGTIHWFDAATGGNDLGTGTTFNTPALSTTTTYYAENHYVQTSQNVGPVAAGASNNTSYYISFDCYTPSILVSVAVNTGTAGARTIELRNSAGTTLSTITATIPTGASRVTLNFNLPVATGLRLYIAANASLYRKTTGVSYPYTLSGILSITGSSVGTSMFPYFFDWEVKKVDCISERVPVIATILPVLPVTITEIAGVLSSSAGIGNQWYEQTQGILTGETGTTYTPSGTGNYYVVVTDDNNCSATSNVISFNVGIDELGNSSFPIRIFPNPVKNKLTMELSGNKSDSFEIEINDITGNQLYKTTLLGHQKTDFDFSIYEKGIYFIHITSDKENRVFKLIHN